MLCKIHGIFLWFGLGGYILVFNRKLLMQPSLYLAAFISVLIFSPVIFWNIENNFITWNFHSNRVNTEKPLLNLTTFFQAFLGQIFYNNPINVLLTVVALNKYTRKYLSMKFNRFILFTGLPIILITTFISLFNNVLPHWSGPGFLTLSFVAAAYLDYIAKSFGKIYPFVLKASISLILTITICGLLIINFYPGTMGKHELNNYGKNDFTLDMWGWQEFESQFSSYIKQREDLTKAPSLKIVCNKWFPAAHIDYYVARPLNAQVIGLGSLIDLHHYAWLNKYRSEITRGENAICIVPSNYPEDVQGAYNSQFSSIKLLNTFCLKRSGKVAKYVSVYLLEDYIGQAENIQVNN